MVGRIHRLWHFLAYATPAKPVPGSRRWPHRRRVHR